MSQLSDTVLLEDHLKRLRLPAMLHDYPEFANQAPGEEIGYAPSRMRADKQSQAGCVDVGTVGSERGRRRLVLPVQSTDPVP